MADFEQWTGFAGGRNRTCSAITTNITKAWAAGITNQRKSNSNISTSIMMAALTAFWAHFREEAHKEASRE